MSALIFGSLFCAFNAQADWCMDGYADVRPENNGSGNYSISCVDINATCIQHNGPSTSPTKGDEIIVRGQKMYLQSIEPGDVKPNGHFAGGQAVANTEEILEN